MCFPIMISILTLAIRDTSYWREHLKACYQWL
jgi:hypothetical protein